MPIPSDEQIAQWRARWDKHPGLSDKIADILKGDKPAETDDEEAENRMWKVNEELRQANKVSGEIDFAVYEGKGEKLWIRIKFAPFPIIDLRGIDWKKKELNKIIIPSARLEGSYLYDARLEGSELRRARLEGSKLGDTGLEGADLIGARLEGANLNFARLEGANLIGARLEGADLNFARLEGADLRWARLEGADFSGAKVGAYMPPVDEAMKGEKCIQLEKEKRITTFANNDYLPHLKELINLNEFIILFFLLLKGFNPSLIFRKEKRRSWYKEIYDNSKFGRLLLFRWFYTDFRGVNIDDADTTLAADLRRYVHDQQFLDRFRAQHPRLYGWWNIFTNCGWSLSRVFILSLTIIIIFAMIYANAPFTVPEFLEQIIPGFLMVESGEGLITPDLNYEQMEHISDSIKWFFYSFDIFTNLGIRSAHPCNDAGVLIVFLETICGFAALGLLISVMAQKLARRA
ncbi:MAG: pentapeptide repeat-containing protein [FCB group bacterium]|nr:pentapeptide repeat-containing protein [FCB group bacterium]